MSGAYHGGVLEYDRPEPRPASLLERLCAAGISEDRALTTITQGRVRVGEDVITDPAVPVPWPTAWVVLSSS